MKRYVFSLHRVLRVRAAQETLARQVLHTSAEHAAAAEDDCDVKYRNYQAAVAGAATFRGTALNLLALQQAASRRAREVVDAENSSEAARAELAEAHDVWSAAKQRVQALEQFDERERRRHLVSVQAAEQAAIDDLVNGRAAHRLGERDGDR